jgi:hypothetical protein
MNSRSETLAALVAGRPHVDEVFVGGSWVRPSSRGTHCVVMPSRRETVVTVALPGATEADAAVEAARRAFDNGSWSHLASEDNVEEVELDDPGDGEALVEVIDELVTTVYPLDGISAAYDDMRNGRNIRSVIHFAK